MTIPDRTRLFSKVYKKSSMPLAELIGKIIVEVRFVSGWRNIELRFDDGTKLVIKGKAQMWEPRKGEGVVVEYNSSANMIGGIYQEPVGSIEDNPFDDRGAVLK